MMVRTFVCFDLPVEIREELRHLQSFLKPLSKAVSWPRPEGTHLTLKFLGDVEKNRIAEITAAVARAAVEVKPFALSVKGVGAFPNLHRPRVLWVGVEESTGRLAFLQGRIDEALQPLGFAREERPFSPHLTLGRVKLPQGAETICRKMFERSFPLMTFMPSEIIVMRSDLRPAGAIYTPESSIELLK